MGFHSSIADAHQKQQEIIEKMGDVETWTVKSMPTLVENELTCMLENRKE